MTSSGSNAGQTFRERLVQAGVHGLKSNSPAGWTVAVGARSRRLAVRPTVPDPIADGPARGPATGLLPGGQPWTSTDPAPQISSACRRNLRFAITLESTS